MMMMLMMLMMMMMIMMDVMAVMMVMMMMMMMLMMMIMMDVMAVMMMMMMMMLVMMMMVMMMMLLMMMMMMLLMMMMMLLMMMMMMMMMRRRMRRMMKSVMNNQHNWLLRQFYFENLPWWRGRQSQWWQQQQRWCCSYICGLIFLVTGALAAWCPYQRNWLSILLYCRNLLHWWKMMIKLIEPWIFGAPQVQANPYESTLSKACPYQWGWWTSTNQWSAQIEDWHKNRFPINDAQFARITGWLKKMQCTIHIRPLVASGGRQTLHCMFRHFAN